MKNKKTDKNSKKTHIIRQDKKEKGKPTDKKRDK